MDIPGRQSECDALAPDSVGPSWRSYSWEGRQWALPIDAAAQVQAWRRDLIDAPALTWNEALALARKGLVNCPMRPPHSLIMVFTLCANLGVPCAAEGPDLFDSEVGVRAACLIREFVSLIDPACFDMDPIAVLEQMARADAPIACAPLTYGYVSYSYAGFRTRRISFADIPVVGTAGPVGSTLGGTGVAVSANSGNRDAAIDFAFWVASPTVQLGPYAAAGGQPAHSSAWADPAINEFADNFFTATRRTLEGAWVRPRHKGYMSFQTAASASLNEALKQREKPKSIIETLNSLFRSSLQRPL
jgi:multiple sugar transport system substrate-binding protein